MSNLSKSIEIILIVLSLFFFSCNDTEPYINSVKSIVIFDYEDYESLPSERISVFLGTEQMNRLDTIRAVNENTGLEWLITKPRKFIDSDKHSWAGSTNLVPASGDNIPTGKYSIYYKDASDRECESFFYVMYPEILETCKASDVEETLGKDFVINIALYEENGELIFYGKKDDKWSTNELIKQNFPNAITMRLCYTSMDGKVVCMMPIVHFNVNNIETKEEPQSE